jgi:Holliday junction resolvase-like predicted endonuclease
MKEFDPKLYQDNDDAKYLVIQLLESEGWYARVNPDPYGIDILASKRNKDIAVEVEVKHSWKAKDFPFDTVQIPCRKQKFAELAGSWFAIISSDRTQVLITDGQSVAKSNQVIIKNKYVSDNEKFYQVPLLDFTLHKL